MKEFDSFDMKIKNSLEQKAEAVMLPQHLREKIVIDIQSRSSHRSTGLKLVYEKMREMPKKYETILRMKKIATATLSLMIAATIVSLTVSEKARVWAKESIESAWIAVKGENGTYSLQQVPVEKAPNYDTTVTGTVMIGTKTELDKKNPLETELGITLPQSLPDNWKIQDKAVSKTQGNEQIKNQLEGIYIKGTNQLNLSVSKDEWWKNTSFHFTQENRVKEIKIGDITTTWYHTASPRYGYVELKDGGGGYNTNKPVGVDVVDGLSWEVNGVNYILWEYHDQTKQGELTPELAAKMAESVMEANK